MLICLAALLAVLYKDRQCETPTRQDPLLGAVSRVGRVSYQYLIRGWSKLHLIDMNLFPISRDGRW